MITVLATCAATAVLSKERHHSLRDGYGEVPSPVFGISSLGAGDVLMSMIAGTSKWYRRFEQYFI